MSETFDIFISYARENEDIVARLHGALKARGWSIFRDVTSLQGGDHIPQAVKAALANAKCVVVLWTDASVESDWVYGEATAARKADKLISVRLQKVDVPTECQHLLYIDLFGWTPTQPDDNFDKLVDAITKKAGPPGAAGNAPVVPTAYVDWIKRTYADVDLLGQQADQSRAFQLDNVYVPALTPIHHDGQGLPKGRKQEEDGPRYEPLLQRLGDVSCYVLAQAGTGKSTFCRWAVLRCVCDDALDHPVPTPEDFKETVLDGLRGRLPVLVPLREFGPRTDFPPGARSWSQDELESALARWVDVAISDLEGDELRAHLAAGTALLLFDGLDELPEMQRKEGTTYYPRELVLSGLMDALPRWLGVGNRVMLTGRPAGMERAGLHRLGLQEVALAPLPGELQKLFVERWFHTLKKVPRAAALLQAMGTRPELVALVENPMLLTSVCILYDGGGQLPQDRYNLYKRLVANVLFNRFPGGSQETDPITVRLQAIATRMHEGAPEEPRQVPSAKVARREAEQALKEMANQGWSEEDRRVAPTQRCETLLEKSGLLLPRSDGQVEFYHLSFQEYLAAEFLHKGDDEPAEVFERWQAVHEWRPTLLFLFAALLENKGPGWITKFLSGRLRALGRESVKTNPAPAHLLAESLDLMIAKGRTVEAKLREEFIALAQHAIEDEIDLPTRHALGLTLGSLHDPRVVSLRDASAYVAVSVRGLGSDLRVGQFPVTNSQYAEFVEDGGYGDPQWWDDEGWSWLQQSGHSRPRFAENSSYNRPNQPVVGVSYYEAQACAAWAGARLLVETEWEAVARGGAGRDFPWGDHWENGLCNTWECGLRQLSAVGLFPRSVCADYNVHDMAGNLFEWCQPKGKNRSEGALRGGSWVNYWHYARSDFRLPHTRHDRNDYVGFRLCLSLPS